MIYNVMKSETERGHELQRQVNDLHRHVAAALKAEFDALVREFGTVKVGLAPVQIFANYFSFRPKQKPRTNKSHVRAWRFRAAAIRRRD